MTYPLGTGSYSVAVSYDIDPAFTDVPITATHTWGGAADQDIFAPTMRTVGIFVEEGGMMDIPAIITRTWHGVGGFIYLPSFPQLNRNETTYPHAT